MARESELYTRWRLEMRRSKVFHAGERVGVAVSGGPDSILLLEFMKQFAAERGLTLAAIHFNHHLRGAESDADERFVEQRAHEAGLEFIGGGGEVARVAREKHCNVEATGRELRYRFFFSLVSQGRVHRVATAHTANDQAETVLLRLVRGTGTRGLGGIYPALEGGVVRPFLSLTRQEVETEIEKRKLPFRTDATNLDKRLARNKVRRELLPWLARELNPRVVRLLSELAERTREEESYLEQQARERSRLWRARHRAEERIAVSSLTDFPPALTRRILRQMIADVRGGLKGVSHAHIEAVRRFATEAQSGKRLVLPDLVVSKEFNWLVIGPSSAAVSEGFSYRVQVPGAVRVPQLGVTFHFKIVSPKELRKSYNGAGSLGFVATPGLDPLKVGPKVVLRNWRPGDRFQPWGSLEPQKVKELLRQRRVPITERALWPVLETAAGILWVRGFPPAGFAVAAPDAASAVTIWEEAEQSTLQR